MKKILCLALGLLCLTASAANADIVFSTSASDASAGSDFTFVEGQSGNIHVWVSTETDQTITGLSLDILSSSDGVITANNHVIENPNIVLNINRWGGVGGGTLGSSVLVNDSNATVLGNPPGVGIATTGLGDFVLHSTLTVDATAIGSSNLSFEPGLFDIVDQDSQSISDSITYGTGTVTVNAIPEPSSVLALGVATIGFGAYQIRRRRKAKKA